MIQQYIFLGGNVFSKNRGRNKAHTARLMIFDKGSYKSLKSSKGNVLQSGGKWPHPDSKDRQKHRQQPVKKGFLRTCKFLKWKGLDCSIYQVCLETNVE